MRGDGVLARGGQKDPTDEGARGSRKKSYFVPALKSADPQIRPRSLTFPSRPAGGPAGPARSLAPWTAAPTAPPTPFLLLFQGRLGASRRKSRPSPLPPTGSGAEGPSRPRSRAVNQRLRPRPDPRGAPPRSARGPAPPPPPGLERPRMRPGEAMGAGRGRGLESEPRSRLESGHDPGLWSSEGRERHRVCDGVRERTRCDGPGIETQESHSGSPPLSSFSPLVLPGTPAATSARDPKSQADGPWSERWCHLAGRVGTARGGGGGDPRLREALTTGWGGASAPSWVGQRLPPPPQVLEARLPSPQAGTQQKDLKELRAPIVCTWRPVVALSVRSRIGEPSILLSLTPPSSRSSLGGAD